MSDDTDGFRVTAIYGAANQRGLVEIGFLGERTTVTPTKAREMATYLLEGASAAEGDEVVVGALTGYGLAAVEIATVLLAVRRRRAQLEQRARAEARRAMVEDAADPDLAD